MQFQMHTLLLLETETKKVKSEDMRSAMASRTIYILQAGLITQ